MSKASSTRRPRIPVRFVDGVWECSLGGAVPVKEHAEAELVVERLGCEPGPWREAWRGPLFKDLDSKLVWLPVDEQFHRNREYFLAGTTLRFSKERCDGGRKLVAGRLGIAAAPVGGVDGGQSLELIARRNFLNIDGGISMRQPKVDVIPTLTAKFEPFKGWNLEAPRLCFLKGDRGGGPAGKHVSRWSSTTMPPTSTVLATGSRRFTMNVPASVKPAVWGVIGGAIAAIVVGFAWGGWVTGGTAGKMEAASAEAAIVQAFTPLCVAKAQHSSRKSSCP